MEGGVKAGHGHTILNSKILNMLDLNQRIPREGFRRKLHMPFLIFLQK